MRTIITNRNIDRNVNERIDDRNIIETNETDINPSCSKFSNPEWV